MGQQVLRLRDGFGDVAAAEDGRVGKAVDEVDDEQAERGLERQRRAEALACINRDVSRDVALHALGGNALRAGGGGGGCYAVSFSLFGLFAGGASSSSSFTTPSM